MSSIHAEQNRRKSKSKKKIWSIERLIPELLIGQLDLVCLFARNRLAGRPTRDFPTAFSVKSPTPLARCLVYYIRNSFANWHLDHLKFPQVRRSTLFLAFLMRTLRLKLTQTLRTCLDVPNLRLRSSVFYWDLPFQPQPVYVETVNSAPLFIGRSLPFLILSIITKTKKFCTWEVLIIPRLLFTWGRIVT